jgi:formylglycine-generating enzyme
VRALVALALVGCAQASSGGAAATSSATSSATSTSSSTETAISSPTETPNVPEASTCPDGMLFVHGSFCPNVERTCLRDSPNGANHLTLCHQFLPDTRCVGDREERAFCIDEYEYPNEKGAHPTWMVTWYDAVATCESKAKRLCDATEWTMACEGPDELPFPYGYERDNSACNFDNEYIAPSLEKLYTVDPPDAGDASVQAPELARLDQSVKSGAMDRCVSGYGVHDMTGNFDEWVDNDEPIPQSGPHVGLWAALKGGGWGHVRNACRPTTVSHSPGWAYYFVAFRCCADARGFAPYVPPSSAMHPPTVKPEDRAPTVVVKRAPGPSKKKVKPFGSK